MSFWRLSFKYKLVMSVSAIIISIVAVAFMLIETLMEKYVTAEIEKDLVGTRITVAHLMQERRARLEELAVALASDTLIRTILIEKGIDRVTRDDILDSEILPGYPQLALLAVLEIDGSVRAISKMAAGLEPVLRRYAPVRRSLGNRPAIDFIRHEGSFLQIAVIPVRIGIYVREIIGAVAVGMPWSIQDLKIIRELSHAEIAFFDTAGAFLSTGPPFATPPGKEDSAIVWSHLAAIPSDRPYLLPAGPERFIIVKISEPDEGLPPYMLARSLDQQLHFLNQMRRWLLELGIGGVLIGCAVSFILALGISRPIHILQSAFRRVAQGNFEQPATVRSRDEFAELATSFNYMQQGLIERAYMKQALLMAEEVQRNFLPAGPPRVKNLDITGASIYCNAIGGDYYDFLKNPRGAGMVRIVLGDVCGHGTAAALLMASSRALLRSYSVQSGPIEDLVSKVNRELSLDMKETGRFLTLFLVEIDPEERQLRWVRAGHDPAIFYDPATDTFENLGGSGMALGIDETRVYDAQSKSGLVDGQILFIGTDGIWEAHNAAGEMFGKDRLYSLLRRHAGGCAQEIADAVLDQLRQFRNGADFEDDVTLVVVKLVAALAAK